MIQAQAPCEIVYFPITVDADAGAGVRTILDHACGDAIVYMDTVAIAHKHQSKIWIGLRAGAFGMGLHALIAGLPSAELGTVRHIHGMAA